MLKQALLYGLAGIIAQLLQYFTLPVMAVSLSADQFGIVSILESVMFLTVILLTFSVERGTEILFRYFFVGKGCFCKCTDMDQWERHDLPGDRCCA